MNQVKGGASSTADREIILSRIFDAPQELVWKVWTDPDHVPRWWGPQGFTTTTKHMDVKPAGVWRYVMHGPDGRDYQNVVSFLEVVRPQRLVYKHGGEKDTEPVNFTVTVTFEKAGDSGEKTRLTMRSIFPSKNAREFVVREYNAIEGGKQTLARLDEYLARAAGSNDRPASPAANSEFVISRVFQAPRDLVFKAWTEADRLGKWFGPKGVTIPTCTIDLRVGGIFHYCTRTPDGKDMWGKWVFREIVKPERLVFVVSFSDENRGITRHPLNPEWPIAILSAVTFVEHAGIGRGTVVTVRWSALNPTEVERKTFDTGHESMRQGWTGAMDQLTEYLAKAQ